MKIKTNYSYLNCLVFYLLIAVTAPLGGQNASQQKSQYSNALRLERLRMYDQAVSLYRRLFEAEKHNNAYYLGLKRNLERLGENEAVLDLVHQRMAVVNDAMGHADLGRALYGVGKIEQAEKQWEKTLNQFEKNSSAYVHVANAMLSERLTEKAEKVYLRGRDKLDDPIAFSTELASLYVAQEKYADASEQYLLFYHKNPRQFRWIESQILNYIRLDDSDEILALLEDQADNSDDLNIKELYANASMAKDRFDQAFDVVTEIESSDAVKNDANQSGRYFFQFAQKASTKNENQQALRAYEYIINALPKSPFRNNAQLASIQLLVDAKQFEKALPRLDQIIERQETYEALSLKAEILAKHLQRSEEAIGIFERLYNGARDRNQKRALAVSLGDAYLFDKNLDSAESWYRTALNFANDYRANEKNEVLLKLALTYFVSHEFSRTLSVIDQIKEDQSNQIDKVNYVNDGLELAFLIEDNLQDSSGVLTDYAAYTFADITQNQNEAIQHLERILESKNKNNLYYKALLEKAKLHKHYGEIEKHETALRKIIADKDNNDFADEATFLLGVLLYQQKKPQEALATLETIFEAFPATTFLEDTRQLMREIQDNLTREALSN